MEFARGISRYLDRYPALQIDGLECVSLADDRLSSIIIDQEGKEFVISERDTLADPLRSCHTHCQQGQGFEK